MVLSPPYAYLHYTYMPGTVKIMGDPRLDPWDVLTVCDLNGETYKVPVMDMTHEFDGGLITSVEAVGRSEVEQESGYKGPTTKEMDRYYGFLDYKAFLSEQGERRQDWSEL